MFGAFGRARRSTNITFVSQVAYENGIKDSLGLSKRVEPVRNCRQVTKRDMIHNDAMPHLEVNPETYEVRADGELLTCEPAQTLPMTQRYFLF